MRAAGLSTPAGGREVRQRAGMPPRSGQRIPKHPLRSADAAFRFQWRECAHLHRGERHKFGPTGSDGAADRLCRNRRRSSAWGTKPPRAASRRSCSRATAPRWPPQSSRRRETALPLIRLLAGQARQDASQPLARCRRFPRQTGKAIATASRYRQCQCRMQASVAREACGGRRLSAGCLLSSRRRAAGGRSREFQKRDMCGGLRPYDGLVKIHTGRGG